MATSKHIFSLGVSAGVDYAVQFLLPIALVRFLTPEAYGHYRYFWLVAGTVMIVAPFCLPYALFHFLPRAEFGVRARIITNTLAFLVLSGSVAGVLVMWAAPNVPGLGWLALFVALWIPASIFDCLANADQRIQLQARLNIISSMLRVTLILGVAYLTRDVATVFAAMNGFAALRLLAVAGYARLYYRSAFPTTDTALLKSQLVYAFPFSVSHALFMSKTQAEHWLVAHFFPVATFASYSIAGYIGPLMALLRQTIANAVLPSITQAHEKNDVDRMLGLQRKVNLATVFVIFPTLGLVLVYAEEIVRVMFTEVYLDAANVMRVYAVGYMALGYEVSNLLRVYSQGAYSARLNFVTLILSVAVSWCGLQWVGLPGAALGSVVSLHVTELLTLRKVSRLSHRPIGHIIDWRAWGGLLCAALISVAAGWYVFASSDVAGGILRLMTALIVTGVCYLAFCGAFWRLGLFKDALRT